MSPFVSLYPGGGGPLFALLHEVWRDDGGALIATEWVAAATLLVIGSITAMVAVRQAVIGEFTEFSNALMSLDQSYGYRGQTRTCGPNGPGGTNNLGTTTGPGSPRIDEFSPSGQAISSFQGNGTVSNDTRRNGPFNIPGLTQGPMQTGNGGGGGGPGGVGPAGPGGQGNGIGPAGLNNGVMGWTAGSSFVDSCNSIQPRSTPPVVCSNAAGTPCD